jgi:tRNA nucleotidyltransferase (CCA-adding enzyme)
VWQELAKGLMAKQPSRLLQVLRECGALHVLLPEVDRLYGVPQPPEHHPEIDTGVHLEMVLDETARVHAPLEVRFAALCHDLGKGTTDKTLLPRHIGHEQRSVKLLRGLCKRWRVPVPCRELAEVVAREHGHVHGAMSFGADALLRLLVRCDAIRRPDRFERVLMACECDARGRLGLQDRHYPQAAHLHNMLKAALSVDTARLSALAMQQGLSGMEVGAQIEQARVKAIASALADSQR